MTRIICILGLLASLLPCSAQSRRALLAAKPPAAAADGGISVVFTNALTGTVGGMSAVDAGTTSGTLLVAVLHYYSALGATPISDSKGNTWTARTDYTSAAGYHIKVYYCVNPTVGASHTFSSTADYCSISLVGVTGNNATPYDTESGNNSTSASTLQPGSITPSVNGCLLVTGLTVGNSSAGSIDSGFTLGPSTSVNAAIGSSFAYKIQSTAAAINPTWSNGAGASPMIVDIAAFKP